MRPSRPWPLATSRCRRPSRRVSRRWRPWPRRPSRTSSSPRPRHHTSHPHRYHTHTHHTHDPARCQARRSEVWRVLLFVCVLVRPLPLSQQPSPPLCPPPGNRYTPSNTILHTTSESLPHDHYMLGRLSGVLCVVMCSARPPSASRAVRGVDEDLTINTRAALMGTRSMHTYTDCTLSSGLCIDSCVCCVVLLCCQTWRVCLPALPLARPRLVVPSAAPRRHSPPRPPTLPPCPTLVVALVLPLPPLPSSPTRLSPLPPSPSLSHRYVLITATPLLDSCALSDR
jgi:hypothetical protein